MIESPEEDSKKNSECLSMSSMERFFENDLNISDVQIDQTAMVHQHKEDLLSSILKIRHTIHTVNAQYTPRRNIFEIDRSHLESKKLTFPENVIPHESFKDEISNLKIVMKEQSAKIEYLESVIAQFIGSSEVDEEEHTYTNRTFP